VRKFFLLALSHLIGLATGFALGIYMLPVLTAPPGPSRVEVESAAATARFTGHFLRDLEGSDVLHWGEGQLFVSDRSVSLVGRVAPGPDYRLYLSPEFVETEAAFLALKDRAIQVGEVRTFENFIVPVPVSVDVTNYSTVVIWCESFSQFITAARYLPQN
jgi:hypothetical protein